MDKINIKKEHFTIDTKYNYLEAPIFGIPAQLLMHNSSFLQDLYNYMINSIKDNYSCIAENSIYYDIYGNIAYLTNGTSSIQSLIIDKIEDIEYRTNRLSFSLSDEKRTINYIATQEQVSEFEDFVIDHNLKKIAQNFNPKTDKLINTTPYTKFIIDSSRDRAIYCANLNKFSKFSYIITSFSDINKIQIIKSGLKHIVRFYTNDKEILDVTCDKKEIAQYIEAQLAKNLN